MDGLPVLLTMQQVQAYLGISKAHTYRLVRDGELRSVRLGQRGGIRVRVDDLQAFLDGSLGGRGGAK